MPYEHDDYDDRDPEDWPIAEDDDNDFAKALTDEERNPSMMRNFR
jgi:hypothetical protein